MSEDLRWSKFWWQDWRSDTALRVCPLAARGLWIEMLALMHEAKPRGHLLVNGRAPDARRLAALVGGAEREVKAALEVLGAEGVFSTTPEGVIFSRRMVKETKEREDGKAYGKRGGNPSLKAKSADVSGNGSEGGLTPPLNRESVKPPLSPPLIIQEAEAETEAEEEKKNPPAPRSRGERGNRLSADWQASEGDVSFARGLGVDPRKAVAEFRDYWTAVPGARGVKLDWSATFRNSCRMLAERGRRGPGRHDRPSPMDILRAMDEADASRGEPQPVFSERIN